MSLDDLKVADENTLDFGVVTPHAPGGTLRDFLNYWRNNGYQCAISAEGTQLWFPNSRGELMRLPIDCLEQVDPTILREILCQHGIWVVTYLIECDEKHPANCFYYVCRNQNYQLSNVQKRMRRTIRHGFRNFSIRLCTLDELADKGFVAYADTDVRHGRVAGSRENFRRMVEKYRGWPLFEVWGAWQENELAAWTIICKIDNWACFIKNCSCTDKLDLVPNNVLHYAITRRSLVEEKKDSISCGVSSIYGGTRLGMHNFKTRMGYEAIPVHRVFVLCPLLRHMAASTIISWIVEKVSGAMPQFAMLQKASGMLRVLSGREKNPLVWAEDKS